MPERTAHYKEKTLSPTSGFPVLILGIILPILLLALFIFAVARASVSDSFVYPALIVLDLVLFMLWVIMLGGLKVINPNEAGVFVLFGKYYGTIDKPGFFWINPFCRPVSLRRRRVSLKAITLNNEKQKVNDRDGNPIEIGVIVIWRVVSATMAVFEVDDFEQYIATQCDATMRHVARLYPYDISDEGDERSLRGSSNEVAEELKKELQSKADIAGIQIIEARISHLAYAQEIAAAMLQRQQATAIIAARQKIVEGAVGMVEMALDKLAGHAVVELDNERKAQIVSNLLVVLCGNKDPQPIINSGTIY